MRICCNGAVRSTRNYSRPPRSTRNSRRGSAPESRRRLPARHSAGSIATFRNSAALPHLRTLAERTRYNAFADEAITQAAVHWLLACVFVRFLEDNGWLDTLHGKVAWISGQDDRLGLAKANRTRFLRPDPALTDRDYLLHVFEEVAKL